MEPLRCHQPAPDWILGEYPEIWISKNSMLGVVDVLAHFLFNGCARCSVDSLVIDQAFGESGSARP
ncbi:MAG: hypothetical protein KDM64_15770 [Verrucomicrobiae bacterium]|nr:hypothetical protein [Verrucomicrobiae bacterium]